MVTTIEQTNDYKKFKLLNYNRDISRSHVEALARAMAEKPESLRYRPVLVNEKMEIVDGQHRFEAARKLGLPIYYQMEQGLTISDAQDLNAIQKTWGPTDYARSFADAGNPHYQKYLDVRHRFGVSHNVALAFLTDRPSSSNHLTHTFKTGRLVIEDYDQAVKNLELLEEVGERYQDWRRKGFGLAYLTLLKHPEYDHERFLERIEKSGGKYLQKFDLMQDYQRALERLFNEYQREDKLIRLF